MAPVLRLARFRDGRRVFFALLEAEGRAREIAGDPFAGDPLTEDRKNIAAPVYSQLFRQWRVTLLPGPLLAARNTVFLVSGKDKQEALKATLLGPYDPKNHPAQIAEGRVEWFLDQDAAGLLV